MYVGDFISNKIVIERIKIPHPRRINNNKSVFYTASIFLNHFLFLKHPLLNHKSVGYHQKKKAKKNTPKSHSNTFIIVVADDRTYLVEANRILLIDEAKKIFG